MGFSMSCFFLGGGGCCVLGLVQSVLYFTSCNSMFQKMLPLIYQIHEKGNNTLNFVTSSEVFWHQTYTHYSVIQLVMDSALLTTQ